MPQQPTTRTLTESEFNTVKEAVLARAPRGLSETMFNAWIEPNMRSALAEAERRASLGQVNIVKPADPADFTDKPAGQEGSAVGRFLSNAGEMLNPVTLATGLYGAVRHPVDTAVNVARSQYDQGVQAVDMAKQGRYSEMVGHGVAAALPLIGPAAAEAGQQIGSGDVAGGLGKGTGLVAPFAALPAVRAGARAVVGGAPKLAEAAAAGLESKAGLMAADVITPKVGANKLRFANQARELVPNLLKRGEGSAWTREGLHSKVGQGLAKSEEALDAAADARNAGAAFKTKPILDALLEQRKALTAEAVDATGTTRTATTRTSAILDASGKPATATELKAKPLGSDVVPGPNAARVAQLDQAIGEIRKLGPEARYESLRRIRQAYDGPAKAIYAPSVTADYLKAQGGKMGAADVTGTLREALGKFDPATAAANADYHLYRTLDDVMQAAKETEAARPKIGRRMAAILFGGASGASAGGVTGAAAGAALFTAVDAAAAAGWTTKLKAAQLMTNMSKALRAGNELKVRSLASQMRQLSKVGAVQSGRLTSPNGLQPNTAER